MPYKIISTNQKGSLGLVIGIGVIFCLVLVLLYIYIFNPHIYNALQYKKQDISDKNMAVVNNIKKEYISSTKLKTDQNLDLVVAYVKDQAIKNRNYKYAVVDVVYNDGTYTKGILKGELGNKDSNWFTVTTQGNVKYFDLAEGKLDCPYFIHTYNIPKESYPECFK